MNNWIKYALAAVVVTAAGFVYVKSSHRNIPADLRDAVADFADIKASDIKAGSSSDISIPVPSPYPTSGLDQSKSVAQQPSRAKSIYGGDDRYEYYEVSPDIRALADSVVGLTAKKHRPLPPGSIPFPDLCPGERFADQPRVAHCSGFLVSEDIIATAGHCVDESDCSNLKLVFGLGVKRPGIMPPEILPPNDVYFCSEVLVRRYTAGTRNDDFALVRIDRPVVGHRPLPLNRGGGIIAERTPVFTIGHSHGLPLKIAKNAFVRGSTSDFIVNISSGHWFVTSSDTFGGNSGAPMFNAATGLVEGIAVRGGESGETLGAGDCVKTYTYGENEGWGEESTSISVVLPFLDKFVP